MGSNVKHVLASAAWLLVLVTQLGIADTFTVQPRFVPPHAVAAGLAPLLGPGEAVTTAGNKVLIRAPSNRVAELRTLAAALDVAPRRLLLSVRERGEFNVERADLGPDGLARQWQTRSRNDGMQRVQALDGEPAMIRAGQAVPVPRRFSRSAGGRQVESFEITYRPVHTGFIALPRVHGEQVTVEIYRNSERPSPRTGHFDTSRVQTVLRGRLGEWLTIGGLSGPRQDAITSRTARTRRAGDRVVELRVTPLD